MTNGQTIRTLFAQDIDRRIEEVIKVDQTDESIVRDEITEYITTEAIKGHYRAVLREYRKADTTKTEGIAVWVSGFFGSGKSSFAKMLGFSIENRKLEGDAAGRLFAEQVGDAEVDALLRQIEEHRPTHAVIFDVSTDRGIRSGNQSLTEIMYRQLLASLGYSSDLDLSELEIGLEDDGRLEAFKELYRAEYGVDWDQGKNMAAFALGRASAVMSKLEPQTYENADSWNQTGKQRFDPSPNKLAARCTELVETRQPGKALVFVIDEVGQFVARDVQKMLDLQGIVQALGVEGQGRHWIVVTSQEKLGEMVSGLDDKRIELGRLMDRFPQQVHLEPSDISEVTSRRVLSKNASARETLGKLFDEHQARIGANTKLSGDVALPELSRTSFIDLYPLLPYQVDLIIDIVSGLRTQGGSSKHVGGANRTIIKLAQQVLIHDRVGLADRDVGALVRLDHIYDLVEGNIASDVRGKISSIAKELKHPLAPAVAKTICLLQFVKSVHRTAENIAAALYPHVGADSQLAAVKAALQELETAQKVRHSDDGYRIPTPAEDDWEQLRSSSKPTGGEAHRIQAETIKWFWSPAPTHSLLGAKTFKAGLSLNGRLIEDGDLAFEVYLEEDPDQIEERADELRKRSQTEQGSVFWSAALNEAIDRHTVEIHRSKDILARKERDARTADEATLVNEEKQRQRRHEGELRHALKTALLGGTVYFRGNDRSPSDSVTEVSKAAAAILEAVLPDVFPRFGLAAAKTLELGKGTDALLKATDLQGLPGVFSSLGLLRDEAGKSVFRVDDEPLKDVFGLIEQRNSYGELATGKYIEEWFKKEPFGWEFEAVRLFVLCLLRAGSIEATSRGQLIESATGNAAREVFEKNPVFRAATFRRAKDIDFSDVVKAAEAFKATYGHVVKELAAAPVAVEIKEAVGDTEESVVTATQLLSANGLPGGEFLQAAIDQMRSIRRGANENAIIAFTDSAITIRDANTRAVELEKALSEPTLHRLRTAHVALSTKWPFLETEPDIDDALADRAAKLEDFLALDTFFRHLPAIDQHTKAIEVEYQRRYDAAMDQRTKRYEEALAQLRATPGWAELEDGVQAEIAAPLEQRTKPYASPVAIPQIRADAKACTSHLQDAIEAVHEQHSADVVTISLHDYFAAGVADEDQLMEALRGIREEVERLIGEGKTVYVR